MNRVDAVTAAIEQGIPATRLVLFTQLAAVDSSRDDLVAVLSAYRPSEVITGGYELRADDVGITVASLTGRGATTVPWAELAGYLAAASTPELAAKVGEDFNAAIAETTPRGVNAKLARLRSSLAFETVTAAGLLPPSLFADSAAERVLLDGRSGDDEGFAGRVTLHPVGDHSVDCRVNGFAVVTVAEHSEIHRVTVTVPAAAGAPMFTGTVRHVPPSDSASPLPALFAPRVGAEVLDQGGGGARWALQVDGFDTVIVEAGNGVHARVRVAVYDQDPQTSFLRHSAVRDVPAHPEGDTRGAAAARRLGRLRRPPGAGLGR